MPTGIEFTNWTDSETLLTYPTLYFEMTTLDLDNQALHATINLKVWKSKVDKAAGSRYISIRGLDTTRIRVDDATFNQFFLQPQETSSDTPLGVLLRNKSYQYVMLLTNTETEDPHYRPQLFFDFKNDGTLV